MSTSRDFITTAESECLSQLDSERSTGKQELESIQHILWMNFQDSAKFTASLYKDRLSASNSLLYQFQTCAIAVTRLYKDSVDAVERAFELGQLHGKQGCRRDLASWTKRRKRKINRLELLKKLTRRPYSSNSDNDSDELSGVLSTLGVASPISNTRDVTMATRDVTMATRDVTNATSSTAECSSAAQASRALPGSAAQADRAAQVSPPHSPPHCSSAYHSRKRKASSLFDEFLETVHSAKRNKPGSRD